MPYSTTTGGVQTFYEARPNPATAPDPRPTRESTRGNVRQLEWNFTFDNPPGLPGTDAQVFSIPANSLILNFRVYEVIPANSAGGTATVDFGTRLASGTAVDADGFVVDLTADGAGVWTVGAGALIGTTSGTAESYFYITPSAALTAGQFRCFLEYITPEG